MTMLTEKFDAYGDVLPDVARDEREAAKTASVVLSRIGQYAFWLLVIVIVSARVIFYPASRLPNFPAPGQACTRLFVSGLSEFLVRKADRSNGTFSKPGAVAWRPATTRHNLCLSGSSE